MRYQSTSIDYFIELLNKCRANQEKSAKDDSCQEVARHSCKIIILNIVGSKRRLPKNRLAYP